MSNKRSPRRKRIKRNQRLDLARQWLRDYSGKHIVKSYAKWYGVDILCAITELRMNGIQVSEEYEIQIKQSIEAKSWAKRLKKERKNQRQELLEEYSDGRYAYIAGYTSNGVPFGIPHEEMEENSNKDIREKNR
ncbi:MAG: hypothetical protein H6557_23280 [Lewinellaceae bacterium]|nr:hypothetical protein [Lewinellaceae bacterium]